MTREGCSQALILGSDRVGSDRSTPKTLPKTRNQSLREPSRGIVMYFKMPASIAVNRAILYWNGG